MMQDPSICSDVTLSIEGANQNVEFAKISLIVQPTKRQPSIRPAIIIQTTEVPRTSIGAEKTSKSTSPTDVSPPAFSKVSFIDRCDQRVGCSVMTLT